MNRYFILIVVLVFKLSNTQAQIDYLKYVPESFTVVEKYLGDLNTDGKEDCVLIIKGTDETKKVVNRFDRKVDRNRRGIIVLLGENGKYKVSVSNLDCFYSEHEDGGVYYAPQLSVEIENGNLMIMYEHGRYGYWNYTFRYENTDFNLIEYNATSTYGPVIQRETVMDFLTMKKLIRENTNEELEGNDEVFKETLKKIALDKPIKLSEIKDFEELDLSKY